MSAIRQPADSAELRRPLPRGRHGIPRDVVAANQRARLLWAASLEIYERGYTDVSVVHITARAGVSRFTFYELFENRLDCILAVQEVTIERLRELIASAYASEAGWAEGVAAAVSAVLRFAAVAPEQANLVRISTAVCGEPELSRRGQDAVEELATAMREANPSAERPSSIALREQAAIGGATAVIGARLLAQEPELLFDLRHELIELILAPYIGDEEAKSIAAAA